MAKHDLPSSDELRRSSAAGLLTGVLLLSVVVLSRRAVGAAAGFSSPSMACLVAGAVMLIGLVSGLTLNRRRHESDFAQALLFATLAASPGLLMGFALMPGTDATGLTALLGEFTILIVSSATATPGNSRTSAIEDSQSMQIRHESPSSEARAESNSETLSEVISPMTETVSTVSVTPQLMKDDAAQLVPIAVLEVADEPADEADESAGSFSDTERDPHRIQWMQRSVREGCDTIEGSVRITFPRGVKQVAVHVPFTPAFSVTPEFEAEPLDDSEVEVQLSSLHTYGVRFEVSRRVKLQEEISVEIGYLATAELLEAAAA